MWTKKNNNNHNTHIGANTNALDTPSRQFNRARDQRFSILLYIFLIHTRANWFFFCSLLSLSLSPSFLSLSRSDICILMYTTDQWREYQMRKKNTCKHTTQNLTIFSLSLFVFFLFFILYFFFWMCCSSYFFINALIEIMLTHFLLLLTSLIKCFSFLISYECVCVRIIIFLSCSWLAKFASTSAIEMTGKKGRT